MIDGDRVNAAPGALLMEGDQVIAAGQPKRIGEIDDARVVELPESVLMPALVNAHAHLDLSHIDPTPFEGSFVEWIAMIRQRRATTDKSIRAAVERGIELSLAGGTAIVGDIAGVESLAPLHALRASALHGVSFVEVFGTGSRSPGAESRIGDLIREVPLHGGGVALGLQPHAPYSCGPEVYAAAAAARRPLSTHLHETLEEIAFSERGDGPIRDMLQRFGVFEEGVGGFGRRPAAWVGELLASCAWLAVHLNYAEDSDLEALRGSRATVVYCPRASSYFRHPAAGRPPHRYREMAGRGIPVALGTDGLVCLSRSDRISVLDEVRHLFRQDGGDPQSLLRMATVHGAVALEIDPALVTLRPGRSLGILAVPTEVQCTDPIQAILRGDARPRWLQGPCQSG